MAIREMDYVLDFYFLFYHAKTSSGIGILTDISNREPRRGTPVCKSEEKDIRNAPNDMTREGARSVSNLGIDFGSHELALRRVAIHSFISSSSTLTQMRRRTFCKGGDSARS